MSYPFDIDVSKVKFKKKTMPLIEFITDYYPITNCNPIGQRPPVYLAIGNPKSVEICESILLGIDIGQITLVCVKDEEGKWVWESVDGGHRKRAIYYYFDGRFKVFGKFYSELSDEEKKLFKNYELSFTLYEPLDTFVKGYIFRNINKTTDVNNQETLNSFGNIAIANVIRETVRPVTVNDKITEPHDFFEVTSGGNFKWSKADNLRLKLEEFVTRYYYRFYKGGDIGSRKFNELESMFKDESVKAKSLKNKVDALLNFLLEMAKARKYTAGGGLAYGEMNTLANLYLYIFANHGDWSLEDPMEFYRAFSTVYNDYYHDPDFKYEKVVKFKFEAAGVTIKECFRNYVVNQDSYAKQEQLMKWITSKFDVIKYITLKDSTRCFPNWMKEITLQKQKYVCAIDGEPLIWDDAEGAHIDAHHNGGKTILSNCAMIRKCYNSAMGTMSVTDYKAQYEKEKSLAA